MKIYRGLPFGETQVGFAGSPTQVLLQQKSDEEGLFVSRRWIQQKQLPLNNENAIYLPACRLYNKLHLRFWCASPNNITYNAG